MTKIKKAPAKKVVAKKIKPVKKIVGAVVKRKIKKTKSVPLVKKVSSAKLIKNIDLKKTKKKTKSGVPLKRIVYMLSAMVLGLLISAVVNAFLELIYLKKTLAIGAIPLTHPFLGMSYFFPVYVELFFLIGGLIFGVWLGTWGWRTVYIEKNHRIFRN